MTPRQRRQWHHVRPPVAGAAHNGRTDPLGRVVLAPLSSFFGWLRRNRRIERNPCGNVHRPDAAPARDRTLTDNEIVAFWHACDDLGEPIGPRLKLLLLTGCRHRWGQLIFRLATRL